MAKKKKVVKKKMAPAKVQHKWKFPDKDFYLLRLESLVLVVLTLAVFTFMLFQFEKRVFPALVVTVGFLVLYFGIAFVFKKLRTVQESYQIAKDHLHIVKKVNKKTSKEKVHVKDVKAHKFDKTFLGAYLVTEKKRYPIYFNTKEELEKLKQWVVSKSGKKVTKKRKK